MPHPERCIAPENASAQVAAYEHRVPALPAPSPPPLLQASPEAVARTEIAAPLWLRSLHFLSQNPSAPSPDHSQVLSEPSASSEALSALPAQESLASAPSRQADGSGIGLFRSRASRQTYASCADTVRQSGARHRSAQTASRQ